MWGHNEKIITLNQKHYNNAKERMEKTINEAKKLLEDVEQYPNNISSLQQFQFPPVEGHTMLDEGTKRFKALTQAYNDLFPNRKRNNSLTKEECKKLTDFAMDKINLKI